MRGLLAKIFTWWKISSGGWRLASVFWGMANLEKEKRKGPATRLLNRARDERVLWDLGRTGASSFSPETGFFNNLTVGGGQGLKKGGKIEGGKRPNSRILTCSMVVLSGRGLPEWGKSVENRLGTLLRRKVASWVSASCL